MSNLDTFLEIKFNKISGDFEKSVLYEGYYNEFDNDYLRKIFALIHSNLNELFSFMNSKNTTRGGHYNADQSRGLIGIIDETRVLQANLKQSEEKCFEINDYYKEIMDSCRTFLLHSGGSPIPEEFALINIIEDRPIFTKAFSVEIKGGNGSSYINIEQIGGGSYAKVFKYEDPRYGIKFALKRAKENLRDDELKRFKNEFGDLKDLDSPFIIKAYTYNEEKNEYTMELADQTLQKFMKYNNNSLSFDSRRALVIQLLKAFSYIRSKGLLHRDISYQNILIKKFEDGMFFIKVSDFGLVKRPDSSLTRQGTDIKGAINDYSDLELVGFENYEIRHETYALAKVIYFILTGRETNYNTENIKPLRNFILKAIGDKNNRFNNINDMESVLIKEVFPAIRQSKEKILLEKF